MQDIPTNNRSLTVFGTIDEAWRLVKGSKWAMWAPLLTSAIVYLVVGFIALIVGLHLASTLKNEILTFNIIAGTLGTVIVLSIIYIGLGIMCGILKIAIERGRGHAVTGTTGFHSFSRALPMLFVVIFALIILIPGHLFPFIQGLNGNIPKATSITSILSTVYVLAVMPLIYMSFPLVVDKKTNSPLRAITQSFKASRPYWLKLVGIFIILEIITFALSAPLMLGLAIHNGVITILGGIFPCICSIWTTPFTFLIQGVVYHKLFD